MELAVTAFRLMAPALQVPSRDREVEMQASVQAASAGTVDTALARVLASLAEAAELLGVAEVADLAAEAAGRLAALRLEVAVVGEFKRGKSSLINALVGREVLPVGVLPLTAAPTVLEDGEEGLVVEFADGRQEHHRLDRLAGFVAEESNPGNALGVARVIARLHTPLLDAGVRLVDTPGVGSVHEHNTRSTDAYLPSLDAAVLVTSADPPISKAERGFLERVLEHAVRLFVVLNKADYLMWNGLSRGLFCLVDGMVWGGRTGAVGARQVADGMADAGEGSGWWGPSSPVGTTCRGGMDRQAATLMYAGRNRRSAIRRKVPLTSVVSGQTGGHSSDGDRSCDGGAPARRDDGGPPC
jgi:GTP-binding protein EngB required for normal cell division